MTYPKENISPLRKLIDEISALFQVENMNYPRRQAEELLTEFLSCSRSDLYSFSERNLSGYEEKCVREWVERRLAGEPLAYISQKITFYDCLIAVNHSVLIPRPETEVLVDKIVSYLKTVDLKGKVLWDLCCGSGCIGIALKKALPALDVYLSDYSQEAIAIAQKNAKSNAVNVTCLTGDFFNPFGSKTCDYLVCNPPYISEEEYRELEKDVKEYEPSLALVAGKSGLEFYHRLARELPRYLRKSGKAWFEIGYQQGEDLKKLFQGPSWKRVIVENDWAGHDRFFFLENE